ncbi:MAG: hypothetical protein QOF11_2706 [Chloroflexota bacterium]|jgi:hypothetical protein|nr:hypothetical protein [Chloroflexota bacterium]
MSDQSGKYLDLIYASIAQGTAKASFTSEFKINDTPGMGATPLLLPEFWYPNRDIGRGLRIVARGILSSTGTPTYTFSCRLGAEGSTSAGIILGSAALVTGSGVTNQPWEFEGDVILRAFGAAGANSTVQGVGMISSPGLASPFAYPLYGAGASPGTVATIDHSIANYINFNVACSASSASNSITLQQLLILGY